ncbi:alanine racemase [Pasteurella atlantica]|uniref:Alanine racemase n=2 Tax=Pasteurellaceae TaxID=712 RepID=A0ACC6HK37_9PAST|nr:alanine racemase [Pasteurella atlantica]MDP8051122.1 alanine racemase [Pasteurella atlantica]MDP8100368.1 alanine racemase [Pasteurella atlantica]MDP8104418.1 alanine racemase [Pasteurella atlantica]MDP8147778.1 alanine racemase [Pasteurella atlantica]
MKSAILTLNTTALHNNIKRIKSLAPNSKLCSVIKANGYGQTIPHLINTLKNKVDAFAVARISEAMTIRQLDYQGTVLLLEGFFNERELQQVVKKNLDTVVHNFEQIEMIENLQKVNKIIPLPINVWIKIDTGMHRLGFQPEDVDNAFQRLEKCEFVGQIRFISHFSCADEPENDYSKKQICCFEKATEGYTNERSMAASGGILYWSQSHYDWIRAGIIQQGISPNYTPIKELGFQPTMTLSSTLIAVRKHSAGEPVGYGNYWVSEKDTKLGVVAIGYGDGYPRNAPYGTPVWVNGRKVPIVGRVSMDMLTVDLGIDSTDKMGDKVILWGEELPIEEVAKAIGVINYELVTQITPRVDIEYKA